MRKMEKKKPAKFNLLLITILVLAACVIIGLVLSAVLAYKDLGSAYASAKLELTFEGAAMGTAPNGAGFDLQALECDEVLSAALKEASLEGVYTPEQIRSCLTVRGVYPDSMAQQVMRYESLLDFSSSRELTVGYFHPTTFNIMLADDFDKSISRNQLKTLLGCILEAYRVYFARIYAFGLDADGGVFDLDSYDYPQQLDIIESRFNSISRYARTLYLKDPTFLFRGASFSDIDVRLNMLLENNITKLTASLTINGLSKDTERLLTQYRYQVHDLSTRRDVLAEELNKLDAMIAAYEKNEVIYLPSSESMEKIDGNSSETYDALVAKRKGISDDITILNTRIMNCNLRIADLMNSAGTLPQETDVPLLPEPGLEGEEAGDAPVIEEAPTAEELAEAERRREAQRAALEEDIRTLTAEGEAVISDFREMLKSYNEQQINESTFVVTELAYRKPRLISKAFVMQAMETAGPIVAAGFIACMILVIVRRKKEENEE